MTFTTQAKFRVCTCGAKAAIFTMELSLMGVSMGLESLRTPWITRGMLGTSKMEREAASASTRKTKICIWAGMTMTSLTISEFTRSKTSRAGKYRKGISENGRTVATMAGASTLKSMEPNILGSFRWTKNRAKVF